MNPEFVLALSLTTTLIAWYGCGPISGRVPRGMLRAAFIALLCSPGLLIGHGLGVAPSLVALWVQPSIFNVGGILLVWIIALGVIFGIPSLRNHRNDWPPPAAEFFLGAHVAKFVLFGIVAGLLMRALLESGYRHPLWVDMLKFGLFFAGGVFNYVLCYWATRLKQANAFVTPIYFAAPVVLVGGPIVTFLWYGGGILGGLAASGRARIAAWLALAVFGLLSANSIQRTYQAANAAAHVRIEGGVTGNAALAATFAAIGIVAWWTLLRHARAQTHL